MIVADVFSTTRFMFAAAAVESFHAVRTVCTEDTGSRCFVSGHCAHHAEATERGGEGWGGRGGGGGVADCPKRDWNPGRGQPLHPESMSV